MDLLVQVLIQWQVVEGAASFVADGPGFGRYTRAILPATAGLILDTTFMRARTWM